MASNSNSNTGFHYDAVMESALNRHSISFQSGAISSSSGLIHPMRTPVGFNNNSNNTARIMHASSSTMVNNNNSNPGQINPSMGGLLIDPVPEFNHDTELGAEWPAGEQSRLEEGLAKYVEEPSIMKYIKIAAILPEKTVRDVALRCRWMAKKEAGKRRMKQEQYIGKKMKERKEKLVASSSKSSIPPAAPPQNLAAYSRMLHQMNHNDRISCGVIPEVGSITTHLLDENAQILGHIAANLETYKIQDNIDLLSRTRNNIAAILNDMKDMPGIMNSMPPLPVAVNDEFANVVLLSTAQGMMFGSPSGSYMKPPDSRC